LLQKRSYPCQEAGLSLESLCPGKSEAETFHLYEGGDDTLAISKERKEDVVAEYASWIEQSNAMVVSEYIGLTVKDLDELRRRIREAGGEFHIVKNTLSKIAFEEAGLSFPDDLFEGTTAIGFAFQDAPGLVKTMMEYSRTTEFLKVKGGYLGRDAISPEQVKSLADLPPLPVVRAQLLGALMAPASQLARTLAEPARMVAAILKAFSEQEAASEAA
jgi:large subunit ribosomal protein L10